MSDDDTPRRPHTYDLSDYPTLEARLRGVVSGTTPRSESVRVVDSDRLRALREQEKHNLYVKGERQNLEERLAYAKKAYLLVCLWFGFVGLVVLLQGFKGATKGSYIEIIELPISAAANFSLEISTINILISSTIVTGFFASVIKNLFPNRK